MRQIVNDVQEIKYMVKSPIYFINRVWGLSITTKGDIFIKGKHLTWQQSKIVIAVEEAVNGIGKNRISIASGHGIGKTAIVAMILIWYLFTRKNAQIACTAPTADQMHDVLWKEVKLWIDRMPKELANIFEWSTGYIRVKEAPEIWFARAKTARKEAPEALAGVHGENVLFLIDEASGVPEEIFNTAEGALTGDNVLVLMISNYTRLVGYFHKSHTIDKENWETMSFDSTESPIVNVKYEERIRNLHGVDSDEYRVRVKGLPPRADAVDDKGYVPLLLPVDIREVEDYQMIPPLKLGIDPAGEGKDTTDWVLRDAFKAKVVAVEHKSTEKTIAQKTLSLMLQYNISPNEVYIDAFGIGAKTVRELSLLGNRIQDVYTGEQPKNDSERQRYLNNRALYAWRVRDWVKSGGEFIKHKNWEQLKFIRYRATLNSKVQIMPKEEMKKQGYISPNTYDALALTFSDDIWKNFTSSGDMAYNNSTQSFDKYEVF